MYGAKPQINPYISSESCLKEIMPRKAKPIKETINGKLNVLILLSKANNKNNRRISANSIISYLPPKDGTEETKLQKDKKSRI